MNLKNFQMSGKIETAVKEKTTANKISIIYSLVCNCDVHVICMFVVAL